MALSSMANQVNAVQNADSEKFAWFRAVAGDDVSRKKYEFLDEMEKAKGTNGARVIAITVPYIPHPDLENVAVVYAMFKGDFNAKQKDIIKRSGEELDKDTYHRDNALLSHLNGYNEEVAIDLNQKPASYHAFEDRNLSKHDIRKGQRMLADLFFIDAPQTLQ